MKKLLLLAVVCLQLLNFATAQWVSDPTLNTIMIGADTTYSYGEIMANPNDSSYYILHYKKIADPNRNYELYMQKFDFNGNKKWAADGIIISQAPQKEWVSGVNLAYNHDSCIYVAYSRLDVESSSENPPTYVYLNKITESGNKLWGDEGIQVSSSDDNADYGPQLMVSNDNNVLITREILYTDTVYGIDFSSLQLKKYSSNGEELWNYNFPLDDHQLDWGAELISDEDDNIICLYRHVVPEICDTAVFYHQSIYSQKFNSEGVALYANPKTLFVFYKDVNQYPLFPINIEADNNGCFYLSTCQQDEYLETQLYIQYFNTDLDTLFPHAVEVSNYHLGNIERGDHSIAYIQGSDELMITWNEKNFNANNSTIYGQAINKHGERLWGEEGKVLYPTLSITDDGGYGWISLRTSGDNDVILFFMQHDVREGMVYVYANKFNNSGDSIWSNTVTTSNSHNMKIGLVVTERIKDQWVAIWDEIGLTYNDSTTILYGQNILTEGKIGTGINEMHSSNFVINIFPNPASSELNISHNLKNSTNASVMLSNALGQNIKTWNISASDMKRNLITLPLENIPNGFYVVSIITDNGAASTKIEVAR